MSTFQLPALEITAARGSVSANALRLPNPVVRPDVSLRYEWLRQYFDTVSSYPYTSLTWEVV